MQKVFEREIFILRSTLFNLINLKVEFEGTNDDVILTNRSMEQLRLLKM